MECCGIHIKRGNFVCIVMYRSSGGSFEEFLVEFRGLLSKISTNSYNIVIGGDFNLDFSSHSVNLSLLEDLLASFDIEITLRVSTRVNLSETCINSFFG